MAQNNTSKTSSWGLSPGLPTPWLISAVKIWIQLLCFGNGTGPCRNQAHVPLQAEDLFVSVALGAHAQSLECVNLDLIGNANNLVQREKLHFHWWLFQLWLNFWSLWKIRKYEGNQKGAVVKTRRNFRSEVILIKKQGYQNHLKRSNTVYSKNPEQNLRG